MESIAQAFPSEIVEDNTLKILPPWNSIVVCTPNKPTNPTLSGRILKFQQIPVEIWEKTTKKTGEANTEDYLAHDYIFEGITEIEDQ